jgi:hypothetical protein
MKPETLTRTRNGTPERKQVLALGAQIAELRHVLDYVIDDVHIAAGCAKCDMDLDSGPRHGRGRPPKLTPEQTRLLALEAQLAKLRGDLKETQSVLGVQNRDFTRCRSCPRASPTLGFHRADTSRRNH